MNILLVHGMWGQSQVWQLWRERLEAGGHRCQAITLPQHETALHSLSNADDRKHAARALARLGVADYVQAVRQQAEVLDDGTGVVLMGHSMGGLLSLMAATSAPERIRAVVSVNGAAAGAVFPLRASAVIGTARHFANPLLYWRSFRLGWWESRYLIFNEMPEQAARSLAEQLVHESGRVAYQLAFGPLNWARSNRLDKAALRCPVLLLAGVRDRIVPIGASRAMARWMGAQATYREYPQAAHWLLGEPGWETVVDEVLAWLQANATSTPRMT